MCRDFPTVPGNLRALLLLNLLSNPAIGPAPSVADLAVASCTAFTPAHPEAHPGTPPPIPLHPLIGWPKGRRPTRIPRFATLELQPSPSAPGTTFKDLATMSVGEKVVSKRSARSYIEYDMEKEPHEDQAKRMVKQDEAELGVGGRKYSASTGTVSSSQSSLETSPLVRATDSEHEVDGLVLSAQGRSSSDIEPRDAFHPPTTNQHVVNSIRELNESLPIEGRPVNFGVVVPGVYRSSFPQSEDYGFIESLKLKTIM